MAAFALISWPLIALAIYGRLRRDQALIWNFI